MFFVIFLMFLLVSVEFFKILLSLVNFLSFFFISLVKFCVIFGLIFVGMWIVIVFILIMIKNFYGVLNSFFICFLEFL